MTMRIGASGRPGQVVSSRSSRRTGGSGNSFSVDSTTSAQGAQGSAGPRPLAAVDSLLAIQEVTESGGRSRKAIRRGEVMLDLLDDVRVGLLGGAFPESKLVRLMETVETASDKVGDPRLAEILDQIELRARVELAKRGRIAA